MLDTLPVEVAVTILRKLDGASLRAADRACPSWAAIIEGDRVLQLRLQRRLRLDRLLLHHTELQALLAARRYPRAEAEGAYCINLQETSPHHNRHGIRSFLSASPYKVT